MKTATKLEIVGTLNDAGILAIRDGLVRPPQLRVLRLASPLNDDAAQIISGVLQYCTYASSVLSRSTYQSTLHICFCSRSQLLFIKLKIYTYKL